MKDLFLSFNSANREKVREIQRLLEARGISTFLDEEHIRSGLPAIPQIEKAVLDCRAAAVFLGPAVGPWQQREIWVALGRQIDEGKNGTEFPVIPVLLPGGSAGKGFLASNSWVDLRDDRLDGNALAAIERGVRGDETDFELSAVTDLCPFRGLEPFREEDSLFFFGRSAVVTDLVERIEGSKLVAVVGSSGSGKSSVVLAGLIPALRKQRSPRTTWEAVSFSPGNAPFARLARALVEWLEPDLGSTDQVIKAEDLGGRLARGEVRLAPFLEKGLEIWGAKRLLLVVDQLEELLTQAKPEIQRPFVQALLAALDEAPVVIVPTIRGDFYAAACDLDAELSALVERGVFNLRRPTPEELREAITGPARLVGLRYEPDLLIEKLLDDVGDEPGNLPLLEYALLELWNQRQGRELQETAYADLRGLGGAIAATAERIYGHLEEAQKHQARQLFVRLVHTSPTTGGLENTRRRALLDDLDSEARTIIQAFAAPTARLLVTSRDETDRETVEVAHERLITAWQRLQEWLGEDIEFRLWRQRLAPSLEYFQKDSENSLTGSVLREAAGWIERCPDELTAMERRLVDTSLARAEAERIERLHQAEHREDSLRRLALVRAQRARLAIGAAVLSLVLATLAFAGFVRAQSAKEKARREAARTSFSVALAALEEERTDQALSHLAAAIRFDPEWNGARDLAISALQVAPVPRVGVRLTRPGLERYWLGDRLVLEVPANGGASRIIDAETSLPVRSLLLRSDRFDYLTYSSRRLLTEFKEAGEAWIWDLDAREGSGRRILGSSRSGWSSLTSDARWLITGLEGAAQLWLVDTGEALGRPYAHSWRGFGVSAIPRIQRVLTSPDASTLQVWATDTGTRTGPPLHVEDSFRGAVLSPDGRRVASISVGAVGDFEVHDIVYSWNVESGRASEILRGQVGELSLGEFSPDGRQGVISSTDGTVWLWVVQSGQLLATSHRHHGEIVETEFSKDSRRLLTSASDGTAQVWDAQTGLPIGPLLTHPAGELSARFSEDVRSVYSTDHSELWRAWNSPSGTPANLPLRAAEALHGSALCSEGQHLATISNEVTVWSLHEGRPTLSLLLPKSWPRSVSFSNDCRFLLFTGTDKAYRWDIHKHELVTQLSHDKINNAVFSADGKFVLTSTFDREMRLWNTQAGDLGFVFANPDKHLLDAVFSPDSCRVAVLDQFNLNLFDICLENPTGGSLGEQRAVSSVAFSPIGDRLISASPDGQVQIWEVAERKLEGTRHWHGGATQAIAFSPDGRLIGTASDDNTGRIWNAETLSASTSPLRHAGPVTVAEFDSDGRRFLTASADGTAKIWDVAEGVPVSVPMGHKKGVSEAHFALDGKAVVTLTDDGKAFLWPVFTSRPEEADLIADLAEAVSGQVAGPTGLEPIEDWRERQDRVIKLVENAPLGEPTAASLGRWLFMDPWERPVSPLFTLTVEQYICDALRHKAWDEAYRYFPGHPLLGKGPEDPLPTACATEK